ncbi:MAG: signal peptidase I [Lachnospiraceae bacterium]|nr:signal peptidase I [Lachnospiraceae bacterium]
MAEKEIAKDDQKKADEKERFTKKDVLEIIFYISLVLLATFLIVTFVAQRTVVEGNSMSPTLKNGDNLIVSKITYKVKDPERFDIIVFPFRESKDTNYIKRIIGLPGETVQIDREGNIYINQKKLEENYGAEKIKNPGIADEPIKLGADEYFVLGDNRNDSKDSRFADVGNIKRSTIIGKAVFRLYPFNKMHVINHDFYGDR